MLARAAEPPSEDQKDMAICELGHGKEPANPLPEEGVLIPNGKLETEDPQGAKVGAKLWRNKYLLGAGVFLLLCVVVSFFAWTRRTPGAVAPSSTAPLPCPNGWTQNEERCYFFSDTQATWNDSQSNCSSFGGSLVTMESQQEMDFIHHTKNHLYIWIGLRREEREQPWKRPNGSLFNNWFPIRGQGWCAYLSEDKVSSTWCESFQFWICSKPAQLALPAREML